MDKWSFVLVAGAIIILVGIVGSVINNWLRVRHGYPVESDEGVLVYPGMAEEAAERVRLLGSENAQLRTELDSVKDRLANVERIVTDESYRLTHQIEALR